MPTKKGKILQVGKKDGKTACLIQLGGKLPKKGEVVTLKWGKVRSLSQNALYWKFLDYLLEDCGLKDQYIDKDELHETFKGRFLAKKSVSKSGFEIIKVGSTADLDKIAFGEYIDKIDKVVTQYCHVDTSPFWEEVKEHSFT